MHTHIYPYKQSCELEMRLHTNIHPIISFTTVCHLYTHSLESSSSRIFIKQSNKEEFARFAASHLNQSIVYLEEFHHHIAHRVSALSSSFSNLLIN